jgi:hypothetical protein
LEKRLGNWHQLRAILGGCDYVRLIKHWQHLEKECPENLKQYDFGVFRDLIQYNTRALKQIELVLFHNSDQIRNLASEEKSEHLNFPKIHLSFEDRARAIRRCFHEEWSYQLQHSEFIREQISARDMKRVLKYFLGYFQDAKNREGLSEGEFLLWLQWGIQAHFENLKCLGALENLRVRGFYSAQFLPKLEIQKRRIFQRRQKIISEILSLNLNVFEIKRCARRLLREVEKIFEFGNFSNIQEAFCGFFVSCFQGLVIGTEIDVLIYRLAYMKKRDLDNAEYWKILLFEFVHLKISEENNWTPTVARIFREKSLFYEKEFKKIFLAFLDHKIEIHMQKQKEERKKVLRACDELRFRAFNWEEFGAGSEEKVAGQVLQRLALDLTILIQEHYRNHYVRKEESKMPSPDQLILLKSIESSIEFRLNQESDLANFEGLAVKIKNYVLNFLSLVFTLGILPLTRKFILKKPAFFGNIKKEITQEARLVLGKTSG